MPMQICLNTDNLEQCELVYSNENSLLTREFRIRFLAQNRYLTNHEAMSAISVFHTEI